MDEDDLNPYRAPTVGDSLSPADGKTPLSRVVFGLVALCAGLLIALSSMGNVAGFVVMYALGRESGFNLVWLTGILAMLGIAFWLIRLGWRELNGRPVSNRSRL